MQKIKEQAQKKHTVITKIWKSSEVSVSGRYSSPLHPPLGLAPQGRRAKGPRARGSHGALQGRPGTTPTHQKGESASRTPPSSSNSTGRSPPLEAWLAPGHPSKARAPCAAS